MKTKSLVASFLATICILFICQNAQAARHEQLTIGELTVETSATLPDSSIGTAEIEDSAITAAKIPAGAAIPLSKLAPVSITDTNATTTITLYLPSGIGQVAFGFTGGTATVWRASSVSTNGWVEMFRN